MRARMQWVLGVGLAIAACVASAPAQRRGSPPPAKPTAALAARRAILAAARFGSGSLTVTPAEVDFNASNPTLQPVVPATTPVRAYVSVTTPKGKQAHWSLSVRAMGPSFNSGAGAIPVSAVTWVTTGSLLSGDGTVRPRAGAATLATTRVVTARGTEGTVAPFQALVTCNFRFHDSWTYVPDTYMQSVLFTLAAP